VNTDIKAIKRFFNRAVELDYLSRSPASKIKLLRTTNRKARFFTESEAVRILSRTEGRVRSVYLTLLLTGMRIGELINLEWEDVDFEGRKIVVRPKEFWSPKGMEERAIPMHRALAHLLIDMPRVSRWVFTKPDGEQLNVHSLETRFRRLLRKLEIENASLHTWRHTFPQAPLPRCEYAAGSGFGHGSGHSW